MRYKSLLITIFALCLTGCLGSLWTGAGYLYDRHALLHTADDYTLGIKTTRALYQDDWFQCPKCHIEVSVFNGDVLLAGHLETEDMQKEAYLRVERAIHPRRLFKFISTVPYRTNLVRDAWITAKVRSQIIADADINPRAFKIVTVDRVVYLMGDVMADQAEWVVTIAKNTASVIRVVKLLRYYHLSDHASNH